VTKKTLAGPAVPPVDRPITLLSKTGPEHNEPEYTLNVTVPVGANPPETVAVSVTELPTVVEEADSAVEIDGLDFVTVRVSLLQTLAVAELLLSPLYPACQL
jgi:hypothetical protein